MVGPAFCRVVDGTSMTSTEINEQFHHLLEQVRETDEYLLPHSLDLGEDFNIFRSLRRGSTARATDMKVLPKTVIDLHNRWRSTELLKGQRSTSSMSNYYTDV